MHSAAGFVAVALALLAGPADSTPICQWVDASGRHQIADVVPERDKPLATCTDSRQYELSPAQRRVAAQGAVERRARALRDTATPPSEPVTGSPGAVGKATRRMAKRPAEVVTDATACPTWWRLYDESGECFAPFRTARGGTKAEAFDVCNEVPSPEPKCGPRRN